MKGAFKESLSREREKLKNMSGKDKAWYLWEYYKFPAALCLAALLAAWYAGSILYRNSFDTVLTCYVVRSVQEPELSTPDGDGPAWLEEELHRFLSLGEKELVHVDPSLIMSSQAGVSDYVYASMAKISAAISSGKLGAVIADEEAIRYYEEMGALETLPGASPGLPCAVSLKNLPALERAGIHLEDPYFAVIRDSSQTEYAHQMLEFLLEYP